jgi:hypothetical protein
LFGAATTAEELPVSAAAAYEFSCWSHARSLNAAEFFPCVSRYKSRAAFFFLTPPFRACYKEAGAKIISASAEIPTTKN